jgi:hypothetical protein
MRIVPSHYTSKRRMYLKSWPTATLDGESASTSDAAISLAVCCCLSSNRCCWCSLVIERPDWFALEGVTAHVAGTRLKSVAGVCFSMVRKVLSKETYLVKPSADENTADERMAATSHKLYNERAHASFC